MYRFFSLSAAMLLLLSFYNSPLSASQKYCIPNSVLQESLSIYGPDAVERLLKWQYFINSNYSLDDYSLLERVNDYINSVDFVEDIVHWKKEDYWATPVEFISSNGGDCEDYAIAKYFTLRALGIEEDRLRIAYVTLGKKKIPHMVLMFFPTPFFLPLVLDNLEKEIATLQERKDLAIIYHANEVGLWAIADQGRFGYVGHSSLLGKWHGVLSKMSIFAINKR